MKPINRIHSFQDLCDLIAKDLALYHDGIENTADDFRHESVVIATSVKKYISGLLANRSALTLHEDLSQIFDLAPETSNKKHDFQREIRPQIIKRVLDNGRRVRRRSSASSNVLVNRNSPTSIQGNRNQSQY